MKKKCNRFLVLLTAFSLTMNMLSVTAMAEGEDAAHDQIACGACGGAGTVTEYQTCPACGGELPEAELVDCPACGGAGEVLVDSEETCSSCGGSGELEDGIPCEDCGGSGAVTVSVSQTCETCGGAAQIERAASSCDTCGGSGTVAEPVECAACGGSGLIDAPETPAEEPAEQPAEEPQPDDEQPADADAPDEERPASQAASGAAAAAGQPIDTVIKDITFKAKDTAVMPGNAVVYELKIKGSNTSGIEVTVKFDEKFTALSKASTSYMNEKPELDGNNEIHFTPSLNSNSYRTYTFTMTGDFEIGDSLTASVEVTYDSSSKTVEAAPVSVLKYPAATIRVGGAKVGAYFGNGMTTYLDFAALKDTTLEQLENAVFSFTGAFSSANSSNVDETGSVVNPFSGRTWQCIGFIPEAGGGSSSTIENCMFVGSEADMQIGKYMLTYKELDDIKTFITEEKHGVLYGETVDEDFVKRLSGMVGQLWGKNYVSLIAVWYLPPVKPIEHQEYGDLSIPAVAAVDYKPTTDGVSIELTSLVPAEDSPRSLRSITSPRPTAFPSS